MSAALALARRERSVLCLEAGKQFGGMLNPFARKKYHFDVGVHYVGEAGPGQAMRRTLDWLGLEDIRFREISPDCIDRYVFGDSYEVQLCKGPDRFADRLAADFPREEANIRRFMDLMRAARTMSRIMARGVRSRDARAILAAVPFGADLWRLTQVPFSEILSHYFDDPLLRNAFAGPGGDIGLPPSRASAFVSLMLLVHYLDGAYYPVGGSGAMRDGFVAGLRAHGAELKRNAEVTDIEVQTDGTFCVRTAGASYRARSVISNVDVKMTADMLRGARPNLSTRRKLAHVEPSLGTFCVFAATDLDIASAGITDSNIWHYDSIDIEAGYAAVMRGEMPERPFFFLTAPSLKDPDSYKAPEGHHTVELLTFAPSSMFKPWWDQPTMKRAPEYRALKDQISENLLARAERYIPGLRDHLILTESATPATVWHFVRGREGGIYGPALTPEQSLFRRVSPTIGIPGLHLCGASVFGAGVLSCLLSGVVAARSCGQFLDDSKPARISLDRALQFVRGQS